MSLLFNSEGGLPPELHWRLQVERFADKVSQKFYNNRTDPIGVTGDQERAAWISLLVEDYHDLERRMSGRANGLISNKTGKTATNTVLSNRRSSPPRGQCASPARRLFRLPLRAQLR